MRDEGCERASGRRRTAGLDRWLPLSVAKAGGLSPSMLPAPLRPAGFPEDLRRDRNLCITAGAGLGRSGQSPRDRPAADTGRALPSPPGSGPAPLGSIRVDGK